jgi:hypothetical protein
MALAATTLLAQERGAAREGRRGPGTDAIKEALNLSDAQVAALEENNQALREAMHTVFEQSREKHKALETELEAANPNPTIVGQMVIDTHQARKQADDMRAEYREKALAMLDEQQKSALTALVEGKEKSPALFQAGALNLVDGPRGGFGMGGPHRGGFMGPRS